MEPTDLRQFRQRLQMSQVDLANLIGVTPNTVARWERGELGMRTTTARLIELLVTGERLATERKRKGR